MRSSFCLPFRRALEAVYSNIVIVELKTFDADVVVGAGPLGIDRTHPAQTVVFKCLMDFRLRVHHKWTIAYHWFVQGNAGDQQHFQSSFRVLGICDSYIVAILRE